MSRPKVIDHKTLLLKYLYQWRNDPGARIQSRLRDYMGTNVHWFFELGYLCGKELVGVTCVGQCKVYTITEKGEQRLREQQEN